MANQKAVDCVSDKVKEAFAEMDTDGSGLVTMVEFREFCKRVKGMEGLAVSIR